MAARRWVRADWAVCGGSRRTLGHDGQHTDTGRWHRAAHGCYDVLPVCSATRCHSPCSSPPEPTPPHRLDDKITAVRQPAGDSAGQTNSGSAMHLEGVEPMQDDKGTRQTRHSLITFLPPLISRPLEWTSPRLPNASRRLSAMQQLAQAQPQLQSQPPSRRRAVPPHQQTHHARAAPRPSPASPSGSCL